MGCKRSTSQLSNSFTVSRTPNFCKGRKLTVVVAHESIREKIRKMMLRVMTVVSVALLFLLSLPRARRDRCA
jgi:hypothetical protein